MLRDDLEQNGRHVFVSTAVSVLRHLAGDSGYYDLQEIWERHPTSIVDFTCHSKLVDVLGRNVVFWEVLDY